MDFGNTSDIVSAVCNIAMASAAVYAAFRANEWLNQKMDEHAFNIAKTLISSDFPKIRRQLREIYTHLKICSDDLTLGDIDHALSTLENHKNYNLKKIEELIFISEEIPYKIESLFKLGWDITKKNHYQLYMKMLSSHSSCFSLLKQFYIDLNSVIILSKNKDYNRMFSTNDIAKLADRIDELTRIYHIYNVVYEEFINNSITVPEYFEIKPLVIKKVS